MEPDQSSEPQQVKPSARSMKTMLKKLKRKAHNQKSTGNHKSLKVTHLASKINDFKVKGNVQIRAKYYFDKFKEASQDTVSYPLSSIRSLTATVSILMHLGFDDQIFALMNLLSHQARRFMSLHRVTLKEFFVKWQPPYTGLLSFGQGSSTWSHQSIPESLFSYRRTKLSCIKLLNRYGIHPYRNKRNLIAKHLRGI